MKSNTVTQNTLGHTEVVHGSAPRHLTIIRLSLISSIYSYSAPISPSLSLAYLSSSLIKAGFDVTPIDCLGEAIDQVVIDEKLNCRIRGLSTEELLELIPLHTNLIGISCMFSQEWVYTKNIIEHIKKKFPHVPIILGGEHAAAMPESNLEMCPSIDACALGEGEETIIDIARNYPDRPEEINGIVYRGEKTKFIRNPSRTRIKNVEDIPRPAWHLLPIEKYLDGGHSNHVNSGRSIPMLATRGCPYQCTFCSSPEMWTTRYYVRSPEDVIDEIEEYIHRYNIDNVDFYDLTAIIKKQWILDFGNLLKKRNLNITWALPSGTRSEALSSNVTKLLAETKCTYIAYAAESGSPRVLKQIKKEVKLDVMFESMRMAKKNGLFLRCNLMLGFPKERRTDVWKTLWFQLKLVFIGVDDAPLFMFSPYPGTELFDYLKGTGQIEEQEDEYFHSLMCFMDLTHSSTICEYIGPRELNFYRFFGMGIFYILSYLFYPKRIIRSIKNIFYRKKTETVFEQRIVEMTNTVRQIRQTRKRVASF